MGSILESLDTFGTEKRVGDNIRKKMDGKENWICPIELKKGNEYRLTAACSGAEATIKFVLLNDQVQTPLAESGIGRKVSLLVSPEEDGLYRMVIMPVSAGSDFMPAKVTVDVLRRYMPNPGRGWL